MCEDIEIYVLGACRTAIGRYLGALRSVLAPELASIVLREAVGRSGLAPGRVEEVVLGCAVAAGTGPTPARQAAIRAGFPPSAGAFIVSQGGGSGLRALSEGVRAIRSEERRVVAAGGMENMSQAPHLLNGARGGGLFGDLLLKDALIQGGLWCAYGDLAMGAAAESAAEKFGLSRQAQDEWTLQSHRRASRALKDGDFRDEIVRVDVPLSEGASLQFETDEIPQPDMTPEKLSRYPAAFKKDGTVTGATASSLSDGAAAVVLASEEAVKDGSLKPLARVLVTASNGLEPESTLAAPQGAIEKAVADSGWKMGEVDLFEIHENFAVQAALAVKSLKLDPERVNINGGALALGDPLGASGTRIFVTLLHALRRRGLKKGVAALSLSGGEALAMTLEVV
jgi:acetyl-CoA C-acetyltransferase